MTIAIGIVSFLVAGFCFYAPGSEWARDRYEAKYVEDADEKQAQHVRTFRYIGYVWIAMGILHLLTV